jgi:hypothetical protein
MSEDVPDDIAQIYIGAMYELLYSKYNIILTNEDLKQILVNAAKRLVLEDIKNQSLPPS